MKFYNDNNLGNLPTDVNYKNNKVKQKGRDLQQDQY